MRRDKRNRRGEFCLLACICWGVIGGVVAVFIEDAFHPLENLLEKKVFNCDIDGDGSYIPPVKPE